MKYFLGVGDTSLYTCLFLSVWIKFIKHKKKNSSNIPGTGLKKKMVLHPVVREFITLGAKVPWDTKYWDYSDGKLFGLIEKVVYE